MSSISETRNIVFEKRSISSTRNPRINLTKNWCLFHFRRSFTFKSAAICLLRRTEKERCRIDISVDHLYLTRSTIIFMNILNWLTLIIIGWPKEIDSTFAVKIKRQKKCQTDKESHRRSEPYGLIVSSERSSLEFSKWTRISSREIREFVAAISRQRTNIEYIEWHLQFVELLLHSNESSSSFPIDCSLLIRRTNDNFKWKMTLNFICYSRRTEQWADLFNFLHCWSRQGERYSNDWINFFLIVLLSMKKKQKKHLIETNEWHSAFSPKLCPFFFFSLPSSISLNIEVKNHFEEKNLKKSSLSPIPFTVWEKTAVLLQMLSFAGENSAEFIREKRKEREMILSRFAMERRIPLSNPSMDDTEEWTDLRLICQRKGSMSSGAKVAFADFDPLSIEDCDMDEGFLIGNARRNHCSKKRSTRRWKRRKAFFLFLLLSRRSSRRSIASEDKKSLPILFISSNREEKEGEERRHSLVLSAGVAGRCREQVEREKE